MHRFTLTVLLLLIVAACGGQPAPDGQRPVIARFVAAPASISRGESSTLSWQVTGATSLSISPDIGTVTASSVPVTPNQTTEYTLTATNAHGEVTARTTVTVSGGGNGGGGDALHDTIAYATEGGDEIRLVNPDGSNDRHLWAHGRTDTAGHGAYEVYSLSWSPDATRLAFASSHERDCSLYLADIFALDADGTDYRRLTQGPACADLARYPKGTVRVPVRNDTLSAFSGFLYFQGAPGVQPVNLPPFGTGMVTFENVADFGPGVLQAAVAIAANDAFRLPDAREILGSTAIDVQLGTTVTTAEAQVSIPDAPLESRSPTWRHDGSSVTFARNFNELMEISPTSGPLQFGNPLLAENAQLPFLILQAVRGPTAATANRILHTGWGPGGATTIHLTETGATQVGTPILSFGSTESVFGLAWFPDGSGFAFTVTEGAYAGGTSSNLFVYDFGSGQPVQVTAFTDAYAGQVSVSGDGQRLVFERAGRFDTATGRLEDRDLWLINRDGSDLELLVENAYAPAWSW